MSIPLKTFQNILPIIVFYYSKMFWVLELFYHSIWSDHDDVNIVVEHWSFKDLPI